MTFGEVHKKVLDYHNDIFWDIRGRLSDSVGNDTNRQLFGPICDQCHNGISQRIRWRFNHIPGIKGYYAAN